MTNNKENILEAIEYMNFKNKVTNSNDYFVYCFFNNSSFNNLKPATTARLIYLSTYLKFSRINKSKLEKELILYTSNNDMIIRENLQNILNISTNSISLFLSETLKSNCMISVDIKNEMTGRIYHGYKIDESVFKRGIISGVKQKYNNDYTKIYLNSNRKLFESLKPTSHIYMGYIYKLLPYVNRKWNILCLNTDETDIHNIVPISVNKLCEIIEYNKHNKKRLLNEYNNIEFEFDGKNQKVIKCYTDIVSGEQYIIVNPVLVYAGENNDRYNTINLFENL